METARPTNLFIPHCPVLSKQYLKVVPVETRKILSEVSSSVGGIFSARDPCSLPRSEQQVADVKRRQKIPNSSSSDELAVIMQKAYLEDHGNQFIREMKILRESTPSQSHSKCLSVDVSHFSEEVLIPYLYSMQYGRKPVNCSVTAHQFA